MTHRAVFRCIAGCAVEHPLDSIIYRCPRCGDLLEVVHDLDALRTRSAAVWMKLFDGRFMSTAWPYGSGVWGKKEWVAPQLREDSIVSMFEGGTNLMWADRYGRELGLADLWVKQCGNSHTGSFKDLGMTVLVSTVKQMIADGKPVYDSQSPEKGGVVGSLLQKALGRPQEFVMTPSGRLDGKRGMNFLVDDASLGELLRAALVLPLPEQDLSELRTWSVDVQEAPVIFHNTRYKFDGRLAAGQAVRGDVAMRLEKAPPSMRISDGTGRQRALFDHAAGMLRESELNFTVTLENSTDGRPVKVVNAVKATTKLKSRSKK